jgi:hypothetical protein
MSEAAPVIFGALIGAGGAIVAQIATTIATARCDRSRLDWEKERQNREWDMREEERFLVCCALSSVGYSYLFMGWPVPSLAR